jgi:hypothetical protein
VLKISIAEKRKQRRLVLEGKLVAPWVAEVRDAYKTAKADLKGRQLVIDVKHLTAISQEGENVLLELLKDSVKFSCRGVFTRHVINELARRTRRKGEEAAE